MSVILNFAFVGLLISENCGFSSVPVPINVSLVALLVNTQLPDHVQTRFISQLINGIGSVLQKLLKYFNGTTVSASFSVLPPSNVPIKFALWSEDFESVIEYPLLHHFHHLLIIRLVHLCNNSKTFQLFLELFLNFL